MNKIEVKKDVFLPNLIACNVIKWYLFWYGDLRDINFWNKLANYYQKNDISELKIDVFKYFEVNEFVPYSKGILKANPTEILFFFEEEVIDEQPREVFIETGYIADLDSNSIIYFDKSSEIVIVGIRESGDLAFFEESIKPYSSIILSESLNYLYQNVFLDKKFGKKFLKEFISNYFQNEVIFKIHNI